MVKLIRLTTENDCEFSANMDADIVLNPDSQIAVQNLTFETVFTALDIGADDSPINMNMDTGNADLPNGTYSTIPLKTYTNINYDEFQTDLTVALNDGLFVKNNGEPTVAPAVPQDGYFFYGQYNVGGEGQLVDEEDEVPILFRQSPIVHPRVVGVRRSDFDVDTGEGFLKPEGSAGTFPEDGDESLFSYSGENERDPRLQIVPVAVPPAAPSQVAIAYGGFCKTHTEADPSVSSAALDAFLAPSSTHVNFCKGSAVMMCRVGSLRVAGTKDEEGFAIGVSDKFIVTGDDDDVATIPTNARTYEIRAYRKGDNYQFIIPGMNHTPADSVPPVAPANADQSAGPGMSDNDMLMICKNGTKMYGFVVTTAGGDYLDLEEGNDWTQAPTAATEQFDTTNLGDIAQYRRTQVGSAIEQWWEAVDSSNWNVYNNKPILGDTPDATAVADLTTGVITFNTIVPTITFTPTGGLPAWVNPGTKNKLFEYDIPIASRNIPLYPYAYICGRANASGAAPLTLDGSYMNWLGMTLDPWAINNLVADEGDQEGEAFLDFLAPEVGDTWASDTIPNLALCADDIKVRMPALDENLYDVGQAARQTTELIISKEILRFMGFTSPQFQGLGRVNLQPKFNKARTQEFGFSSIPNDIFQVTNSDNYVVVLDSHPVLSYDASSAEGKLATDPTAPMRGKRMNIIATIPDNDNDNGAVEYESNELIYIDLDNNFKQNISNLKVRVLNKALGKLNTRGMSVLTLLIKDNARE